MVASVAKSGRKKRPFEPPAEPDLEVQEVSAKTDAAAAYPYDLEFDYMECSATMGNGVSGRTAYLGRGEKCNGGLEDTQAGLMRDIFNNHVFAMDLRGARWDGQVASGNIIAKAGLGGSRR